MKPREPSKQGEPSHSAWGRRITTTTTSSSIIIQSQGETIVRVRGRDVHERRKRARPMMVYQRARNIGMDGGWEEGREEFCILSMEMARWLDG